MKEVTETYRFRQFIETMDKETPKNNYSKTYEPRPDFCTATWKEALKFARFGIKNQAKIEQIMSSMNLLEKVKTKGYGMSEHGLFIDIGSYLSGEPECWVTEEFTYKPKKVVKILASIGYAWHYNEQQVENRGAGIVSLIQMLKKQGYIVKINLYESSVHDNVQYTCFLKIPTNPLDLQSLSYALCSPTLLRRFLFAWMELKENRSNCDTYGSPNTIDEVALSKDIIHFQGLGKEGCDYRDEETTKKYISELFDKFLELNNDKNGR